MIDKLILGLINPSCSSKSSGLTILLRDAHELWTKLQDKYGVSNSIEDDCSPSTSDRDEFSSSSTSPKCGKPQTNVMVSSDRFCNIDSDLIFDDLLSLSCCNASSLDLRLSRRALVEDENRR